jgi:large subunit ribosomal protein L29
MLKSEEARALSDDELRARVRDLEEERFRLKFRAATETLEQPLRLRTVRRDIARCLTILRERELAAAGGRPSPKARRRANRRAPSGAPGAARGATKGSK